MKVIFISDDLLDIEVTLQAIEFETAPIVGDWIDVISFVDEDTSRKIETYLEAQGKLTLGLVNGRSWARKNYEAVMYAHLVFNELSED